MPTDPHTETPCPFCDYAGPSEILRQYSAAYVIEPLNPVTAGHLLVIPRRHFESIATMPLEPHFFDLMCCVSMEVKALGRECNVITSVGAAATQTVMHAHVHIVPRAVGDGLALPWSAPVALAARLEAAERDLADARKAMEFLANETLFGSIVAEYAQKKIAAAQQPPAEGSDG